MAKAWLDADWPAPAGVRALTTLRHGLGESVAPFDCFNLGNFNLGNAQAADGDDPAVVARNRALLVERACLPSAPHWLRQVHGVAVCRFDDPPPLPRAPQADFLRGAGEPWAECARIGEPTADAAVTSTAGCVLAILTADCLPVLLCADDGREVAAAHAGWRGLADGVIETTLEAMRTPPERVMAWLGPAAGPRHYEVGVEVFDAFVAPDWGAGSAFSCTRPQHWRVDLYALARRRLVAAGVLAENIHGGKLCTIDDPQRFYSHRRDRRTGRMASVIWIEHRD